VSRNRKSNATIRVIASFRELDGTVRSLYVKGLRTVTAKKRMDELAS